jgi:hypothetical protein
MPWGKTKNMVKRIKLIIVTWLFISICIHAQSFEIATFNIQNFGQSKMAKTDVVDTTSPQQLLIPNLTFLINI